MERITIIDIARMCNVSIATVNRAFNSGTSINPETRALILETAKKYKYVENKIAARLTSRSKVIKIGIIMRVVMQEYFNDIIKGFYEAYEVLKDYKVEMEMKTIDAHEDYAARVINDSEYFIENKFDGVIFCVNPLNSKCIEKINMLTDGNIKVVTLFEPCENENVVTILNNLCVLGEIAAEMLSSYGCKNVAVFSGDIKTYIHQTIVNSFADKLKEENVTFAGNYETKEEPELSVRLTEEALSGKPLIDGIYVSTANSSEICRTITQRNLNGVIKIITSDLLAELIPYIESGTVSATIYQNPVKQAKTAFYNLYYYIADNIKPSRITYITPVIIIKSNLKLYI